MQHFIVSGPSPG